MLPNWSIEQQENCSIYVGAFAIFNPKGELLRKILGRVIVWPGLPADVYLFNPPIQLRRHPKGPCLQLLKPGDSWFKLHWQKPPRDFDSSCAYVEQLIAEALLGNYE